MSSRSVRALLLGVVATLLAVGIPPGPRPVEGAVSELRLKRLNFFHRFQQGRNYWNANAYLEAASYFQSLMSQYDELPRRLQLQLDYYLGSSLHELELDGWALTHLEAPASEPFSPDMAADAAVRLMDIHARRGEFRKVEQVYNRAGDRPLSPRLKDRVDYGAIRAYYRLGRYKRVRELALELPEGTEVKPRARLLSAMGMIEEGELAAAAEDLRGILEHRALLEELGIAERFGPRVRQMLAEVYFDQGNHIESLRTLDEVQHPAYQADRIYTRAWNYLMMERYVQGLEAFRELVEQHPEDARSIEATVLGGYILLNRNRFSDSYAYFQTLETEYRAAARKLSRFRDEFGSPEAFEMMISDPERRANLPVPSQFAEWVAESREVERVREREAEVEALARRIQEVIWDLRKMRVISAGFGSSFENPATLERILRNEFGLKLTEIRSEILELMVRPVRNTLLSDEYRMVNLAQNTRNLALQIIRQHALPTKERAVTVQQSLRRVKEYLNLVAPEALRGAEDPTRLSNVGEVRTDQEPLELLERINKDDEQLAFFLLRVIEEEEGLWEVIDTTIRVERQAVEQALRRLGIWGRHAYLDRLEQLYRSTSGIEGLLQENGRLLLDVQKAILNDVIAWTNKVFPQVEELQQRQQALADGARQVRVAAVERAWDDVGSQIRNAEAKASAGQLDVGWRAKEVEEQLMRNVLKSQRKRLEQLETYYSNAQEAAERATKAGATIDERLREQLEASTAGDQSVEMDELMEEVATEINRMSEVIDELMRGSAWILERGGSVEWDQEID